MDLITLMVILAVIGAIWFLLTTYIPMPAPMKTVITIIAVVALCILLLDLTGIGDIKIGHKIL